MEIKILDIDGYNKVAELNRLLTYWISQVNVSLRRKSKDWLAHNWNSVSEWGDMSICGLLF
jgi:hypothetical protein